MNLIELLSSMKVEVGSRGARAAELHGRESETPNSTDALSPACRVCMLNCCFPAAYGAMIQANKDIVLLAFKQTLDIQKHELK